MLLKTRALVTAIAVTALSHSAQAQAQALYTYTNDEDGVPGIVAAGVSASDLSWVNGPAYIFACGDGFNSDTWSLSTDPFTTDYSAMELTLTPEYCLSMTITGIQFDVRRNPQGPMKARFAYSIDGGNSWVDAGADFEPDDNPCGSGNTYYWDMADFTVTGAVLFRLYGWEASTIHGHHSALNGFVYGSTASIGTIWYADADGDGYGDPVATAVACDVPAGYTADNTDCNDADAAVNPAAVEVCGNGIDDNCDGVVEEGITATATISGAASVCAPLNVLLQASPAKAGNTYQWYRNGVILEGATGETFQATDLRGYYQVMVTNHWCSDLSDSTYVRIYDPNDPLITTFAGTNLCMNNPIKLKANFGFMPQKLYQWYLNGEMIPGATTARYDATQPGEYNVNVYAEYPGCSYWSTSIFLTVDCRLEAPVTTASLDVYPSPNTGNFSIDMHAVNDAGIAIITVVNLLGEVIYAGNVAYANASLMTNLNIGNVPSGMYTVIVNDNGHFSQQQFMIQK